MEHKKYCLEKSTEALPSLQNMLRLPPQATLESSHLITCLRFGYLETSTFEEIQSEHGFTNQEVINLQ